MGDHPATLPATIPAIAAAGPNAEFDRDLGDLRDADLRDSGVGGSWLLPVSPSPCSPEGVGGSELVRDLDRDEPLLDRGKKVSTGCWSLYLSALRRPPRSFFKNVNSSRISSSAAFHSYCRSSSDTSNLGVAFRMNQDGIVFLMRSSGIIRIITATGIERNPKTTE